MTNNQKLPRGKCAKSAFGSALPCCALFEDGLDGALLTKLDGTILGVNPRALQLLGMTEAELMACDTRAILVNDEKLREAMRERDLTGRTEVLVNFKKKNGTIFEGKLLSSVFTDTDGITKASLVLRAVSDNFEKENSLQEKERLNKILLDALPCVALLLRPETREIVASNKFAAAAGAVPGKRCYSTWAKRETPCTFCLAPELWNTGKPQHVEVESAGTIWDAYWTPISDDLYMHYAFDITERKKTENARRESVEKYSYLFNHMLNGFAHCKIILNEKGDPVDFEYLEVNDAFEKLTGFTRSQVVGKRITEAIPGTKEAHPDLIETYGRVALTGKTEHFEVFFKPLGSWFATSAYSPMKGYFVTLFENITERKLAERKAQEYSEGLEQTVVERTKELTEANERLVKTERFAAIGELAGMVGHDLRNPLTAIKNAVYYLDRKQSASMDAKTKEMFKVIDKSVEHANRIISNLLEYSKEISLEIEEATPKSLMDYILLMAQIPSHVKVLDRTEDEPTIWVDMNKMERVFINIINNAVDAMPEKGSLEIRSCHAGGNVEFAFIDTGVGMSEQTKAKIFMPLFTTKAKGMGFGLAICKRIVEAHGGKISVESTAGKGTTFVISIPIEQKPRLDDQENQVGVEDFSVKKPESTLSNLHE